MANVPECRLYASASESRSVLMTVQAQTPELSNNSALDAAHSLSKIYPHRWHNCFSSQRNFRPGRKLRVVLPANASS